MYYVQACHVPDIQPCMSHISGGEQIGKDCGGISSCPDWLPCVKGKGVNPAYPQIQNKYICDAVFPVYAHFFYKRKNT